jgi:hypothetical protein
LASDIKYPPLSALIAAKTVMANDSRHEQSAGGLRDHFHKNKTHARTTAKDSYELSTFNITTQHTGIYKGPKLQKESADLLNNLLKVSQADYHVYFSETGGFHNHRIHHLLAAYALGATPQELQLAVDTMEDSQRPRITIEKEVVDQMYDQGEFESMLGDDRHYCNYLAFFLQRFEKDGWKNAVNEYLFSDTKLANDLLVRLFAGNFPFPRIFSHFF